MQLSASDAGASSASGNDGWLRSTSNLDVTAEINVSRLFSDLSRARRTSAEENREKTSSTDSGSCQNYKIVLASLPIIESGHTYAGPVWIISGNDSRLR